MPHLLIEERHPAGFASQPLVSTPFNIKVTGADGEVVVTLFVADVQRPFRLGTKARALTHATSFEGVGVRTIDEWSQDGDAGKEVKVVVASGNGADEAKSQIFVSAP